MQNHFGTLPCGEAATLYTISGGHLKVSVTNYGATLVRLLVDGTDVVLGYDDVSGYACNGGFVGATVGRNANRISHAAFDLNGRSVRLEANEGVHNLHSGPDGFDRRLWKTGECTDRSVHFTLDSPDGDQGFPGQAKISVCYAIDAASDTLSITYEAVSTQDTVFNFTNHSYFNLAGADHPEKAMNQVLMLPARIFTPDDAESIPTGECRSVEGTPFDFRRAKPLGRDLHADYEPLHLQSGYDHNFEVFCEPCAVLSDPESGRTMAVSTDCPGLQLYTANFLDAQGKNGVHYGKNSGVCLETQYFPDSVHHPEWAQPVTKAGQRYRSVTRYRF